MERSRPSRCLFVAALVALVLAGCAPTPAPAPAATAAPTPVAARSTPTLPLPTAAPLPSNTPPPTAPPPTATDVPPTETPTTAPMATPAPPATYEGWNTYREETYGFSFRYPPGWVVEEDRPPSTMLGHGLWVRDPELPEVHLRVGFRWMDEDQQITPTGIGGGEFVPRGSVLLLGEELPRIALVGEGKDLEVLYGGTGAVTRGNLDLFLRLSCTCTPLTEGELSLETQVTADAIVTSFERVE